MSLQSIQSEFAVMIAKLILVAEKQGIQVTFGEAYRPKELCELYAQQGRGIVNSLHEKRLAIDLNVFIRGEYISDGNDPALRLLHTCWSGMGGAEPIENDMNHFSLEHENVR